MQKCQFFLLLLSLLCYCSIFFNSLARLETICSVCVSVCVWPVTSPRWESPSGPLVSGFTIITRTPGRIWMQTQHKLTFRSGLLTHNHTQLMERKQICLQFLTPWGADSEERLSPPVSPCNTHTRLVCNACLPWDWRLMSLGWGRSSLPVVAEGFHVYVNSGRIWTSRTLFQLTEAKLSQNIHAMCAIISFDKSVLI